MPPKKQKLELPDHIAELSDKAKAQYVTILHSLNVDGGAVSSSDVLEYVLETMHDMERMVGDPEEYILTLNNTLVEFEESWNYTVLGERNPNAKMLKTLGITGKMVFKWVAERFQFVKRDPPAQAEQSDIENDDEENDPLSPF